MKSTSTPSHMIRALLCSAFLAACLLAAPLALADKGDADADKGDADSSSAPTSPSAVSNMPRLGVDSGDVMDPPALSNAQAVGARIARLTVLWSALEPSDVDPTQYNWASTDSRLNALASRGIAPLVVILGCPTWACVTDTGPLNSNMRPEMAEFMRAMVTRYSAAPYNVHYWEMWNEPDAAGGPNNQWGWGLHPDGYAQMLASVYPAIKAVDPNAVVMPGGLAYDNWFHQGGPFNPDFLDDFLANNGARYVDALSFHYYKNNNNGWTNISLKVDELRSVMARHGVNLPVVCSESGLTSSADYQSSEAIQARYLVQMNVHSASRSVQTTLWYLNRDFEAREPGWGIFASSGLTRLDNTRKPSFTAMQVFSREVSSGVYMRQLGPNEGMTGTMEGHRFMGTTSGRQTSVVWNNANSTVTLTIPASQAPELQGAVNLYGRAVSTQPGPGGTILVSVPNDPIYLQWNSPRFSDVPFSSWMYEYVEYLALRGYISGYSDGTFRPGNNSTRGQFSKMIVLGMGWPINTTGGPHFNDVPQSNAFYGFIETAYNHEVISGYTCGASGEPCPGVYFRPVNNITRAQISKLIVLAKGWTLSIPSSATFSDVPVGSPFFAFVETAVTHSVVSGYSDGTFRPGNNATRAQLSKMLAVALQQ